VTRKDRRNCDARIDADGEILRTAAEPFGRLDDPSVWNDPNDSNDPNDPNDLESFRQPQVQRERFALPDRELARATAQRLLKLG
jgi:hypothetical protein